MLNERFEYKFDLKPIRMKPFAALLLHSKWRIDYNSDTDAYIVASPIQMYDIFQYLVSKIHFKDNNLCASLQ